MAIARKVFTSRSGVLSSSRKFENDLSARKRPCTSITRTNQIIISPNAPDDCPRRLYWQYEALTKPIFRPAMSERQDLTMRMSMRRVTRLTNAFTKKFENLQAVVSLHFANYNLIRLRKTLWQRT